MSRIDPQTRAEARRQRRDASPAERRVWGALRIANRTRGLNFRRKAPVGCEIADFADYGRRIVVLLDSSEGDLRPGLDRWFLTQGFRVLRLSSVAPDGDLDAAIAIIIAETLASPHPIPPHKGEGAALGGRGAMGASLPLVGREREGGTTSIKGDTE